LLKNGADPSTSFSWEIVQAQREALLKAKYPKIDLSDVKAFNEVYAKEFYDLSPEDTVKLFKGVRDSATGPGSGNAFRTEDKSLETYFSTNPYVAALYAAMIGKAKIGQELPMFSVDRQISDLRNFLGEGAVRNGNAQGSMEFPQLLGGKELSETLPTPYSLPGIAYGQMFGATATDLKHIKNNWPEGYSRGGRARLPGSHVSSSKINKTFVTPTQINEMLAVQGMDGKKFRNNVMDLPDKVTPELISKIMDQRVRPGELGAYQQAAISAMRGSGRSEEFILSHLNEATAIQMPRHNLPGALSFLASTMVGSGRNKDFIREKLGLSADTPVPGKYYMGGKINIPKFDSGINSVPVDMLAMIHKNEAVVPANMNPFNPNANNATMGGATYNITNNINGYDGSLEQLSSMVTQKTITAIKGLDSRTASMSGPKMNVGIN
jgi:hypothetical protein